jgi:hypothetical protein
VKSRRCRGPGARCCRGREYRKYCRKGVVMLEVDFKGIVLDSRGLDFMKSSLVGPHGLSLLLGSKVATERGTTRAYVPEFVPDERAYDFHVGVATLALRSQVRSGVSGRPAKTPNRAIADLVSSVLGQNRGALCLVEDWLLGPSDPGIQESLSSGTPIVFNRNDVYYYLLAHDPWEKVLDTLDEADLGKLVGVISVDSFPELVSGTEISSGLLDVITRGATLIFVTAYDGEGFVIWSNPE